MSCDVVVRQLMYDLEFRFPLLPYLEQEQK